MTWWIGEVISSFREVVGVNVDASKRDLLDVVSQCLVMREGRSLMVS